MPYGLYVEDVTVVVGVSVLTTGVGETYEGVEVEGGGEDSNPGDPLCLFLQLQGAAKASCEEKSASATKSKAEKRNMTALERVWRWRERE